MTGVQTCALPICLNRLKDGQLKDTAANIKRSKEFVVHMCDEDLAEQMHRCGERLPPEQSELEAVGLTTAPSCAIAPPRIAEAPVAFECTLWELIETDSRQIFIGKVVWMHARDELIDTETWRVRLQHYQPIGRFGASFYVKTNERYALEAQALSRSTSIDEM